MLVGAVRWNARLVPYILIGLLALAGLAFATQYGLIGLAILCALAMTACAAVAGFRARELDHTRGEALAALYSQQLDRQKQAIDGFADGLEAGIFVCTTAGEVEYANRSARLMFEFSDPVGRPILAVTLTHTIQTMIRRAVEQGEKQVDELSMRSGELVALVQVWQERAVVDRVFVSIYDITKLRRLERVRQDFVANVSHELRTPLTTIRAMAEIMRETEPEDEALRGRYLQQIEREVDRLTNIVNDLLTLSAAESQASAMEPLDLADIADEVSNRMMQKAESKNIALKKLITKPAMINGNSTHVNQILLNLIDNAINYTQAGHVTVAVRTEPEAVIFEVSDTGVGIAVEHLDRIFERFYRVDKSRSRESGGTGLGLSIVKHLIEAHRGHISVASFLNRGSTFTVRFPLVTSQREVPVPSSAGSNVLDA